MKSKLLFVVPKFNFTKKALINKKNYNYVFPIGMGYIIAVLKKEGYNVNCINLNHIEGHTNEIIKKELDKEKYDFVCVSNMSNGYSLTELILNAVKKHKTNPKTILGGLIITSEPKIIFEALNPDFGIIGEGEETILEFLDNFYKKKDLNKVNGLIYKKEGKTIITEKREDLKDINSLPFPDLESMGLSEYLNNNHPNFWGNHLQNIVDYPRPYPILGSRSCPFNCTFCNHISKYRQRSIDNIMQELEENVEKYNINLIFMYDDCFTLDLKRVYEFCRRIKELQKKVGREIRWGTSMTVKQVTPELLKTMRESGCFSLCFGFESYDKDVLKSMRKPITPEEIDKALKYSRGLKLMLYAGFIFGDVAETKESANRTLKYWVEECQKQGLGFINLGFIQPFPGTELYRYCLRNGIIKNKLEFLKNVELLSGAKINMTKNMTDKELKELEKKVNSLISKHRKFVIPSKVKRTGKNIYNLKITCPFCKKELEYKNNLLENRWSYGFISICRECESGFWITSPLQKFAYKHYSFSRKIADTINKTKNFMGKRIA